MKATRLVSGNGGVQIPSQIRKALGIEPGCMVEVDFVRVVMTTEERLAAIRKKEKEKESRR